jgi:hypothetical protein
MSTKDLSHTIIEGGRRGFNKWDRRYSHKENRAQEKAYISQVMEDPDSSYEYDIEPLRHVYKEFNDKISPIYRWLHAQVGRPWNDVRSDIATNFDTRTTAGRHVVYDHILSNVEETPDLRYGRFYHGPEDYTQSFHENDFYVDANGLLQNKRYIKLKRKTVKFDVKQIANWLSGRVVGKAGKKFFWFVATDKNKKKGGTNRQWITKWENDKDRFSYWSSFALRYYYSYNEPVYKDDKVIDHKLVWRIGTPIFRQDRKLNDKELKFWNTIPENLQKEVLRSSPTYIATEEEKAEKRRRLGL